jgi:hypothetical protein
MKVMPSRAGTGGASTSNLFLNQNYHIGLLHFVKSGVNFVIVPTLKSIFIRKLPYSALHCMNNGVIFVILAA